MLGVLNACSIAKRLHASAFTVVVADVVTPETLAIYRSAMPNCMTVHLVVTLEEARRRARTRRIWLTEVEFSALHRADQEAPPPVDHHLDVTGLGFDAQVAAVDAIWSA